MTEHLISMFIDDELDLEEKITFVESVHSDQSYKMEAVELLRLEQHLRQNPVENVPVIAIQSTRRKTRFLWLRPALVGLSCVAVAIFVWIMRTPNNQLAREQSAKSHRFIIYQPDISNAQITGSFTDWQPRTMSRIGNSGYWEAVLKLSSGEHRFVYILDGHRRIVDPTVPVREKDDFGGENSILSITL
jgi:hypothetical protein